MNNSNAEDLLCVFLECGSLDLSVLDDVEYDLCEIVEEIRQEGLKPTLNMITDAIFRKGQDELVDAVKEKIGEIEYQIFELDEDDEEREELQEELDELNDLDPENDMGWYCNCLDTSCWFGNHEEIYRKYLADEISDIEDNMGFGF